MNGIENEWESVKSDCEPKVFKLFIQKLTKANFIVDCENTDENIEKHMLKFFRKLS